MSGPSQLLDPENITLEDLYGVLRGIEHHLAFIIFLLKLFITKERLMEAEIEAMIQEISTNPSVEECAVKVIEKWASVFQGCHDQPNAVAACAAIMKRLARRQAQAIAVRTPADPRSGDEETIG